MNETATPLSTPCSTPCGTKYQTYATIFFANFKEQQEKQRQEQQKQQHSLMKTSSNCETAINNNETIDCSIDGNGNQEDNTNQANELMDDDDNDEFIDQQQQHHTVNGILYTTGTQSQGNKIRITENPLPETASC